MTLPVFPPSHCHLTDHTGTSGTAARVGPAAGAAHSIACNPGHAYDFGLQRVRDGLAAIIDGRAQRD
jgi:hypothetical protein